MELVRKYGGGGSEDSREGDHHMPTETAKIKHNFIDN